MPSSAHDVATPLSNLLEATLKDGPQVVTKDGVEAAVLVPIDEWKKANDLRARRSGRSLKAILLDPNGPHDIQVPPRGKFSLRPPFQFED
jgi:antitoxin Phd